MDFRGHIYNRLYYILAYFALLSNLKQCTLILDTILFYENKHSKHYFLAFVCFVFIIYY
jgi:hypothetical protein